MQFSMLITGGTVVLFLGLFGAGEGWVLGGLVATVAGVVRLQSQSIEKLNRLRIGISMADVRAVLGEPRHTESVAGRTMLKYELFQWFAGTKPVYINFGPNGKLAEWYVDEKQYLETQKLWLKAFKELRKAQD